MAGSFTHRHLAIARRAAPEMQFYSAGAYFPLDYLLNPILPFANDSSDMCCDAVLCCLENSVKARALVHSGTCGIGILFSGGLDCMIIAALAARCVADHTVIDLFNVAFDAAEAPDRESACAGFR